MTNPAPRHEDDAEIRSLEEAFRLARRRQRRAVETILEKAVRLLGGNPPPDPSNDDEGEK